MPIFYHGTTKKNSKLILKSGFKAGTYFASHLDSALMMGGNYLFHVWFSKKPTEYWEYITDKPINVNRIILLVNYKPKLLYEDFKIQEEIRKQNHEENHLGLNVKHCTTCKGNGQMENYSRMLRPRNRKKVTACKNCVGFGCTLQDGTKMNEIKD